MAEFTENSAIFFCCYPTYFCMREGVSAATLC